MTSKNIEGVLFDKTFYWDKEDSVWKVEQIPTYEELEKNGIYKFTNKNGKSYYINIGK